MVKSRKAFSVKQFSPNVLIKSELIEVIIPANLAGNPKTKIQLPDNQNLRNTHLRAIKTYVFSNMPMSIVSRNTVVSASLLNSIFLTFQAYNGKNFMWQKPMNSFLTFAVNSERFPSVFCGQKVNYPKSYIEIADSSLISTTEAQSVILDVSYSEFEAVEREDRKANFKNQS